MSEDSPRRREGDELTRARGESLQHDWVVVGRVSDRGCNNTVTKFETWPNKKLALIDKEEFGFVGEIATGVDRESHLVEILKA
jgi:hypothetical protein